MQRGTRGSRVERGPRAQTGNRAFALRTSRA